MPLFLKLSHHELARIAASTSQKINIIVPENARVIFPAQTEVLVDFSQPSDCAMGI